MAGQGKVFPIPCRKCGKLALLSIAPGRHPQRCLKCGAVTEVSVQQVGEGWVIRTALADKASSSGN